MISQPEQLLRRVRLKKYAEWIFLLIVGLLGVFFPLLFGLRGFRGKKKRHPCVPRQLFVLEFGGGGLTAAVVVCVTFVFNQGGIKDRSRKKENSGQSYRKWLEN